MHYAPFNPASSELGTLLLLRLAAHKWVAVESLTQRLIPYGCSEEMAAAECAHRIGGRSHHPQRARSDHLTVSVGLLIELHALAAHGAPCPPEP